MSRFGTALLLSVASAAAAPGHLPAQVFKDEFVPGGHAALEVSRFEQDQVSGYDRGGKLRPLRSYMLPNRPVFEDASGTVTRKVSRTDIRLSTGLTDETNLFFEIPYLELEQESHLTTSSARPSHQREVESHRSQDMSGLGDLTALLIHRPVFSDRNGFLWGYGLSHPVSGRDESEDGPYALALRSPSPELLAFLHYTRYPRREHSRFDFRLSGQYPLEGRIETLDQGGKPYRSGAGLIGELGWYGEAGPAGFGAAMETRYIGQSRIDGVRQGDPEKEMILHWQFAFGNLADLEQGPVTLPYQARLVIDRSLRGFNVPYRDGITLSILFLF